MHSLGFRMNILPATFAAPALRVNFFPHRRAETRASQAQNLVAPASYAAPAERSPETPVMIRAPRL